MAKMNLLDRAITAVSPVQGLKRVAARRALEVTNSGYGNYGANVTKKSLIGWLFRGGSAKEDIEDNIDVLRQRSRDAYMGIPTASAALKTLCTKRPAFLATRQSAKPTAPACGRDRHERA